MAVTAVDLIQPKGELTASLFPEDTPPPATGEGSLLARLDEYLAKAAAKIADVSLDDSDAAVKAWAQHLGFKDALILFVARPATETFPAGLGAQGFMAEQLKELRNKAAEQRSAFEEALASSVRRNATPTSIVSRQTPNRFRW